MANSSRTVFNLQSLMMLTGNFDRYSLVKSLYYYRQKGYILTPRKGLYVLADKEYNPFELAASVFYPSYVSLQTVLQRNGVVFQYSEDITVVSSINRELIIDGRKYSFRRINPLLWSSYDGIIQKDGYLIAEPERALLDYMYLNPGIAYFDNTDKIDRIKLFALAEGYKNKSLIKKVVKMYG